MSTFDPKRTKYQQHSGIILCLKRGVLITKNSTWKFFLIDTKGFL